MTTKRAKIIGLYEIVAGIAGIACMGIPLLQAIKAGMIPGILVVCVAMILSAISLVAGFSLWMAKSWAMGLSVLTQCVQLPVLFFAGLHAQIYILAQLALGFGEGWQVLLRYGAGAHVLFLMGDLSFQFAGVNLLALIALALLPGSVKRPAA